jgi:hypothetical protein
MDTLPEMRVVAAAFRDESAALAAVAELRSSLDLGPADIGLAPVGGDPACAGLRALVAGRFRQHRRELVDAIIRRYRGEVINDLPEERVRPRLIAHRHAATR